jgi:hypothetical protein
VSGTVEAEKIITSKNSSPNENSLFQDKKKAVNIPLINSKKVYLHSTTNLDS